MKRAVRKLLGEDISLYLESLKIKFLPSKSDKAEKLALIRRKKLFASFINPGELCFDVGANVGNRIVPLLQIGAKILAVEPQESCSRILHKKFGNNIILIKKGLSDQEGIKKFYVSSSSVLSTFSEEWVSLGKKGRFKDYNWDKVIETEMTTLDKLIQQYGKPVFIKIDVEGYELEVLNGLSSPVNYISFEYAVPELMQKALDCISRISSINQEIECNYSEGESMELFFDTWLSVEEMKKHMLSEKFIKSSFGDIYIRTKLLNHQNAG